MNIQIAKFIQSVFDDGTLAVLRTPEALLDLLDHHGARPEMIHPFLVSTQDCLNELAPVEVLAGKRFQIQIDNPGRLVWSSEKGQGEVIPLTEGDRVAYRRMLDLSVEERTAKVIAAAKAMEE